MNRKKKEKLGDLALDIAKYIITAVLIATWFNRTEQWQWYHRCYFDSMDRIIFDRQ